MDDIRGPNGYGTRGEWHRQRGDPLARKVNALLDDLLWLNMRLNGNEAEELTVTEVARLFALCGENLTALASLLGRLNILTPKVVQQVCEAYDDALEVLLRYHGGNR